MNLVEHTEIRALIDQLTDMADDLTANEREMFTHLKTKYATPTEGAFDDKICLEVMIRNVGIRTELNMKPSEATRVIELPRE